MLGLGGPTQGGSAACKPKGVVAMNVCAVLSGCLESAAGASPAGTLI